MGRFITCAAAAAEDVSDAYGFGLYVLLLLVLLFIALIPCVGEGGRMIDEDEDATLSPLLPETAVVAVVFGVFAMVMVCDGGGTLTVVVVMRWPRSLTATCTPL